MNAAARPGPRRLRSLALAVAVTAALILLGGWGLSPAWFAPWPTKLHRLLETTVVAIAILVAVVVADGAADRGAPRRLTYTLAVVVGAAVGAFLAWELRLILGITPFMPPGEVLTPFWTWARRLDLAVIGVLIGGLATYAHVNRRTALAARRRQHAAEQARAQAQRRTLESELQALQARVEPQFLFATLERVRLLYQSDAGRAGAMLEQLIVYLRAALPHMRESASTVAQETTLARSWLDIVGHPAGDGPVAFSIADDAGSTRLPALVLLPLVQEAVAGAPVDRRRFELRVEVAREGDTLRLGLATSTDAFAHGVAGRPLLEQIDERLAALYGAAARLETRRTATGSLAAAALPLHAGAGDGGAGPERAAPAQRQPAVSPSV